jgi:hypothetical protein
MYKLHCAKRPNGVEKHRIERFNNYLNNIISRANNVTTEKEKKK